MRTNDITKDLSAIPFNPPQQSAKNSDSYRARLFLLKRLAFQYEDEIRIILVSKDKENAKYMKGIEMPYKCENTELIQRLVIDPDIGKRTYAMISNFLIEKYGFISYQKEDGTIFNRVVQSAIGNLEVTICDLKFSSLGNCGFSLVTICDLVFGFVKNFHSLVVSWNMKSSPSKRLEFRLTA